MYFYIKIIAIIENNFQHAITVIIYFLRSMSQILIYYYLRSVNLKQKMASNSTWKLESDLDAEKMLIHL